MQAAGMSPWDLSKPALALALTIATVSYGLTLWLAPESVRAFRELQWTIRQDVTHLVLKEGEFTDVANGVITSYSIHYTKLYDITASSRSPASLL